MCRCNRMPRWPNGMADLRKKFARKLGINVASATFEGGRVSGAGTSANMGTLAASSGIDAIDEIKPSPMAKMGVFAAGRILHMKTATSQATGSMIWGVGAALHEHAVIDPRHGFFVNHDPGSYHVLCHADIPAIEAHFLVEVEDKTNPLKSTFIGKLGICGAGASIANAACNACGLRIHKYSLTMDKVLGGPEQQRG